MRIKDYNGKQFDSIIEMCRYHGINELTFYSRRHKMKSIKECLRQSKIYTDHLGKKFDSLQAMLTYHGVQVGTYRYRLKKGLPLKLCLQPVHREK